MKNNTAEVLKSELQQYELDIKRLQEACEHLRAAVKIIEGEIVAEGKD